MAATAAPGPAAMKTLVKIPNADAIAAGAPMKATAQTMAIIASRRIELRSMIAHADERAERRLAFLDAPVIAGGVWQDDGSVAQQQGHELEEEGGHQR